ncbi:MAG: hypothetical protein AVDCRST_MAG49-1380 [uncultured Thermomicrobiales bacterium]|uniref:Uncharacterized protein n=1 Tax=uncultured Thermomicrobiales bacterium TaxID=1645740 RepID=A0A6J4UG63_9BACT|nr:MAG: hypothetical protein AVDCRST_MAG49-1380 [uncultured Thermomicrobiales bacterium]
MWQGIREIADASPGEPTAGSSRLRPGARGLPRSAPAAGAPSMPQPNSRMPREFARRPTGTGGRHPGPRMRRAFVVRGGAEVNGW